MAARADDVATVLALAARLGVTAADLAAAAADPAAVRPAAPSVPTVADYLPVVVAASTDGCRGTYGTYWDRLVAAYGSCRLDEVSASDLKALVLAVKRNAVKRSNARQGQGAAENCVAALRAFWGHAVADGYVTANPAAPEKLPKPRRPPSRRRALSDDELRQLYEATRAGGNDPALDTLLLRFHLETGARRDGALSLRLRDIDADRQLVRLREKGETERWQPCSATLVAALLDHARSRGASGPDDAVFRYRPRGKSLVGSPLTRRRYNTLTARWGKVLPWVAELGVSIHWIRHTAVTTVERLAGYGVARAFAGHRAAGEVTTTYITATLSEVAAAVAAMTGEPHPLAPDQTASCDR